MITNRFAFISKISDFFWKKARSNRGNKARKNGICRKN